MVTVHRLHDWREDALPRCSAPPCQREIANGDPYVIVPGTLKLLCRDCFRLTDRRCEARQRAPQKVTTKPEPKPRKPAMTREQRRARDRERKRAGYQPHPLPPLAARQKLPHAICPACGRQFFPRKRNDRVQISCSKPCARAVQHGKQPLSAPERAWSERYPACLSCGTTTVPHGAQGRCHPCYMRQWRATRYTAV